MTGAELRQALEEFYGESWRSAGAKALGVNITTIWRQTSKDQVDGPIEAWVIAERKVRRYQEAMGRGGKAAAAARTPERRAEISAAAAAASLQARGKA